MKRSFRQAVSLALVCLMLFGMLPEISLPARAAGNLAGGFEGQDSDVFSALGFDTSEIPEGYNEDTTENPYGRDLISGNQVFELITASSAGTKLYGSDNNEFSPADISSMPESGTAMPGGMQLFSAAAGDFDGDGLPGGIAYVGVAGTSGDQKLYLYFYDGETGSYGAVKEICSAINPKYTVPGGDNGQQSFGFAWQNLLQVTAGDYDGDGTAEIAVYAAENAAARVDIYKYQRTSQSGDKDWLNPANWGRVWSHALSKDVVPNMVSLESGDFNRDGVDDLAIASGSMVFTSRLFISARYMSATPQYSQASTATVLWGAKSRMLQTHDGLDLNSSKLGEQVRVGFAYGDLDGDKVKDLIAVGQPLSDAANNTSRSITSYTYVDGSGLSVNASAIYKVVDGEWKDIQSGVDENNQPIYTKTWTSNNGFDDKYNSRPFMTANAAVMTPAGSEYTYLYADSCLYRYSEGQLQIFYALDEESGQYSAENTNDRLNVSWDVSISRSGTNLGDMSFGFCEYGAVSGDVNGSSADLLSTALISPQSTSYTNLNNGVFTLWGSGDGVTLDDAAAQNTSSRSIVPVLVDVDMDTVIIEYTGVHYLTYSDPQVLAIIAAAPYFEDVDKVSGYDYAWQNTTSYSRIVGKGQSDIITFDFEGGAWFDSDFTTGGGKAVLETSVLFTLEWEKTTTKTTEYELTFETSQDEDAVAFFSIPTENYVYNIHTPNGNGGYDTTVDIIQNTFTPCYQILTLDYYESIQGNYEELPQISGTAITSTPGDPASYPSSTSGYDVIAQWNDDPAGVSFGNGSISQTITITEEQSESYNMGAAWDFKVGGGGGFQSDLLQADVELAGGIQWSLNPAGGWADINLTGTSFSGTVTNMPLEFRDYGYYYSWKLFAYNYVFGNGNSIPVVSYLVGDVSAPPKLPEDFQQDFDRTTSTENVLTWTYADEVSKFYLYKQYDFPVGGGLECIAEIDPSDSRYFQFKTDGSGKSYKEFFFTDANLTPYTEYQYAIAVERLSKVPPLSSPSALLTARTKASEGYPLLYISESDNINDGNLLVYPDKNSYLTVDVKGPQGENASNYYSVVQYQWQKMKNGAWVDMVNETGMTLTFANAGVDTAGSYRCRVNVQVRDTAAYISAFTGTVSLSHAKRTSYIENLQVTDITGGGTHLQAQVKNAHGDSAAIPSGTVAFILTNTSTDASYTYIAELDATGTASKTLEGVLPSGMYTVAAKYSGSYIFKSCNAAGVYLSQMSRGYTIDLPASLVYGNGATITFLQVNKSGGITTSTEQQAYSATLLAAEASSSTYRSVVGQYSKPFSAGTKLGSLQAGKSYRYIGPSGNWLYFTATLGGTVRLYEDYVTYEYVDVSPYLTYTNDGGKYSLAGNTPAGTYLVRMQEAENAAATEALFSVAPRPVTLQLPTQKGSEGIAATRPKLGELEVANGSWAPCDLNSDGTLNDTLANTVANTLYYNTAWQEFTFETVSNVCGYYTIRCTDSLSNYDLTFLDGSITILGATQDVSIGVRPFEGQQVGTLYAVYPDYASTRTPIDDSNALLQSHPTGTRLVFTAVPDAGYEIYDWFINGKSLGTKESSISHVLLYESTSVEVQFAVKQNTLSFGTAGDAGGGTISCSDPTLTSGSVVIANALFTFTAVPKEGYHFKEWRFTEAGKGTVYDDTDFGKEQSTFDLVMPSASCSVYAVFERDFYPFHYSDLSGNDGLTAWYEAAVNDAPGAAKEKIYFKSGTEIKGDTVVTVEPSKGCTFDSEYRYVSTGSQGSADYSKGTYTVSVTQPTSVTGYTRRDAYDVTLAFDVDTHCTAPESAEMVYTLNGEEHHLSYDAGSHSAVIPNVPGGTAITVQISFPGYYKLDGWTSASTQTSADTTVNHLATPLSIGGTVAQGQAYFYTDSGVTYYFTAPCSGTAQWTGAAVTVYASGTSFTIPELHQQETVTVHLTEKDTHTVSVADITGSGTCSYELPDGAQKAADDNGQTVITVHDGDDLSVLVTPVQGKTVTYWETTPEGKEPVITRATSLRYTIPNITSNYSFKPIFSNTTYNTISWPTISDNTIGLTLSPVSGYLSSVVSGGTFKFQLSGGSLNLVDKVYANGNLFTLAGNTVNGTTYTLDGDTYVIENITANQVITVTLKEIGITVNGEDISAITGPGWSYDTKNQALTIKQSNLTVSGSNDPALSDKLSIILSANAPSVTFSDLSLTSAGDLPVRFLGQDAILTAAGSSSIAAKSSNSTLLTAIENLSIRGNGSLSLSCTDVSGTQAVSAAGTLAVIGNAVLDIRGRGSAGGIQASALSVGLQTGSSSPTVRIDMDNCPYGVQAGSVTVYGGELNANASQHAIFSDTLRLNGGIMELSSQSSTPFASTYSGSDAKEVWTVYHPNGYLLRAGGSSENYQTVSKSAGNYSSPQSYDTLASVDNSAIIWKNAALNTNTRYIRLSPFNAVDSENITLTVNYQGKAYSCAFETASSKTGYTYYIDTTQNGGSIQHLTVGMTSAEGIVSETEPTHLIPVAQQHSGNGSLDVNLFAGTWVESSEGGEWFLGSDESSSIQLSYTLSGATPQNTAFPNEGIDASSATVQDLTLDNLTFRKLTVNSNPVYLKGENTLNPVRSAALELGSGYTSVDLRGVNGSGTLTLAISDSSPAVMADSISLHNVSALTTLVQKDVKPIQKISATPGDTVIQYYDDTLTSSPTQLPYGLGWLQEIGSSAASAQTVPSGVQLQTPVCYMKFFAATTDARVSAAAPEPREFSYNKTTQTGITELVLIPPAISGTLHTYDKKTGGNSASGSVSVIDMQGVETPLPSSAYSAEKSGDINTALSLNKEWLQTLSAGSCTIRVYFYDEDASDATYYTLDIPLTVTEPAESSGDLTITPASKVAKRGDSVTFTAVPTGDAPKAYQWSVTGSGTLSSSGSTATLTVNSDAAIGSTITVTVTSYADAEKTQQLGSASALVTVASLAQAIDISCAGEVPSGDGSYTFYHNTDGAAKTWDFDAVVTLDDGQPDPSKLHWSLWGAGRAATSVDETTGQLTIDPAEKGTGGLLKLTATYENPDGSALSKTVIIYLSTDARVSFENTGAEHGSITGAEYGETTIPAAGAWIPAESTVTVTALPENGFAVKTWYVNGQSVMDNPAYTVDTELHTLTFTADAMMHYHITADYVNTSSFVLNYSAGKNGTISAVCGDTPLSSGQSVTKGSSVTLTAVPDEHCEITQWIVDGAVYENPEGTVYTGSTLTLQDIDASHDVSVQFAGKEIDIRFACLGNGTLTLLVNGQVQQAPGGVATVHALDDVTLLADADEGYLPGEWSAKTPDGKYDIISELTGSPVFSVQRITSPFDVQLSFVPMDSFDITVTTNSYEQGSGTVYCGTETVGMSQSRTFTVRQHDTLTLLAVPDEGCTVYRWYVPQGIQYTTDGNSITLLDVQSDLNDIENGQYIGVTFRRSLCDVSLSSEGSGTLSASYTLTIGNDTFSGTIHDSESIRSGSHVTVTADADTDCVLSSLTVNDQAVVPVWDEAAGNYTFTIDCVTENTRIHAVFAQAEPRLSVTVPSAFMDDTQTITQGTADAGFLADGSSGDAAQPAAGTDEVLMAPGGTAQLTFTPQSGYMVDTDALAREIDAVISSAGSQAQRELSLQGSAVVVTISGIDKDLDYTDMPSPFVSLDKPLCEITIQSDGQGTLKAYLGSVRLFSGALVPAGSEITVTATPQQHFSIEELTANGEDLTSADPGTTEETISVSEDTLLEASFVRSEYEVTVNIIGSGSGTVLIDGKEYPAGVHTLPAGSRISVSAAADGNSSLDTLNVPGGNAEPDGSFSLTLDDNLTITAVFTARLCAVTYNAPEHGTLTVLGENGQPVASGDLIPVGTTLIVFADADAHYRLASLTAGGTPLSSGSGYIVNASKNNHIECLFEAAEVPVTIVSEHGTVSITALPDGTPVLIGQYVPVGTVLSIKTSPASENYSLDSLTVTGADFDSSTGLCTAGSQPITVEAKFVYTGDIPVDPGDPPGPSGSGGSTSDSEYTIKITVVGEGRVRVTSGGKELSSGDTVKIGTLLTITATAGEKQPLSSLTVNGVPFISGEEYEVYANTDIVAVFGNIGQPYYLDASGNKVFIGFAYDIDGSGSWSEGEYIAPEGKQVLFTPNHKDFSDVSGHWGKDAITFVTDREVLIGVTDSLFDPDGGVTRAMVATVLGRLYERSFGLESTGTGQAFDDCNYSAYYGKYVDWAAEHGIVKGYGNGKFGPNDLITREQMATMLYRFAQMMQVAPEQTDTSLTYADSESIADWAREGALYCQSEGLMQGVGANLFAPQQTATRAQLATIVSNFIKTVVR